MLTKCIVACLDVRDVRVVKGIQLVDIIATGDLVELTNVCTTDRYKTLTAALGRTSYDWSTHGP